MASLGNLTLGLAFVAALVSVAALFWGRMMGKKDGEGATNVGYFGAFAVAAALSMSTAILLSGFFRQDFTLQYVAENHSTDVSSLSWLYKISGVWAGREGSLLFWAWVLALFVAYIAWKRIGETDELSNMSLAVLNIVQLFFLASLFVDLNNPFKVSPAEWIGPNGQLMVAVGMNPLLQHWAMILHPPTLFIGYAGMTIPFAFAIGALIVGDGSKLWVTIVDRITVFSWLFLGLGIGLGAVWAYVVLGWGGYWAWDPVENASLLPWLTGVGLLHSFTVYRRRDGFKKWAVMMATVSFVLVILGTFITRSGIIDSVHAFEKSPISGWIFGAMMVLPLVAAVWGLMVRSKEFESADEFESLTSKEASYYFNNVIMLMSALVVAMLTVAPAFGGKAFGVDTYNALAHPFGILYVFIMAVCPILSWRKTLGPAFMSKAKWPLISTAVLTVPLGAIWYLELLPILQKNGAPSAWEPLALIYVYSIVGIIVGAFAVSVAVWLFIEGARKRAAAKGETLGAALWQIITKARTQSGGYLTHMGIGIILIGLVGSTMFVDDSTFNVPNKAGTAFEAGGYTFTYQGLDQKTLPNQDTVDTALLDVATGGVKVATMNPGQISFFQQQQTKLNADVLVQPLRDVFVVFQGIQGENVSFQVKINPLISWVWFGFALSVVGTGIAMLPKKQALVVAASAPAKKRKK
ncbi:MAG: cytochrome c biogenesis protein CcsA [Actinomycetota bacterium]|nr:cytochrome c biogenesis protein CcsA [Actinomycetota bacterium]